MTQPTNEFRKAIKDARRVGTPLLAIRTPDPASARAHVEASLGPKAAEVPLLSYDVIGGLLGLNALGEAAASAVLKDTPPNVGPAEAMAISANLVTDAILFFLNPQRLWEQIDVLQGIWNLRDIFKSGGQILILLTTPGVLLPAEIRNDVMVLDEPLPNAEDLEDIVKRVFEAADVPTPKDMTKTIDALTGLASFPAEQVTAMSLSSKGLDTNALWERKRQAIEQTPGLSVWRGGETFADIGGCGNVKKYLLKLLNGKEPPRVVCFIDEIEKSFAGTGTELSGVKTEMTGTFLSWMQDHNADGVTFLGPPGAAKSAVGKAAGASVGIPTIAFDFSGMQNGIIGSSGERLRAALQVVEAISQGSSLWIATCNSIVTLPPELQRRFQDTFFFDLPTAEERAVIWKLYCTKLGLTPKIAGPIPNDEGWTGAEIRSCCRKAWRFNMTLVEAATYVIPVSLSRADLIENLRRQSSTKFLSASHPGYYVMPTAEPKKTRRFSAAQEGY